MTEHERNTFVCTVLDLFGAARTRQSLVLLATIAVWPSNSSFAESPVSSLVLPCSWLWHVGWSDPPPLLTPIRSLHYFIPIIDELLSSPPDPGYLNYLDTRFRHLLNRTIWLNLYVSRWSVTPRALNCLDLGQTISLWARSAKLTSEL